jgi:hypothetical protein
MPTVELLTTFGYVASLPALGMTEKTHRPSAAGLIAELQCSPAAMFLEGQLD